MKKDIWIVLGAMILAWWMGWGAHALFIHNKAMSLPKLESYGILTCDADSGGILTCDADSGGIGVNTVKISTIEESYYLTVETDFIIIRIPKEDIATMSKQELRDIATFISLVHVGGYVVSDHEMVRIMAHKFVEKYIL